MSYQFCRFYIVSNPFETKQGGQKNSCRAIVGGIASIWSVSIAVPLPLLVLQGMWKEENYEVCFTHKVSITMSLLVIFDFLEIH